MRVLTDHPTICGRRRRRPAHHKTYYQDIVGQSLLVKAKSANPCFAYCRLRFAYVRRALHTLDWA
jgi:hypothetical protein